MPTSLSTSKASLELAALFERNGCIRRPNPKRLAKLGAQKYKKGSEVRLTVESEEELAYVQELLDVLDFTAGRPFAKARQFCIPLYGNEQTARFEALLESQAM